MKLCANSSSSVFDSQTKNGFSSIFFPENVSHHTVEADAGHLVMKVTHKRLQDFEEVRKCKLKYVNIDL